MKQRKVVVVDIDGTIAKVGDRLKYLQQTPKDWDSFYAACNEDKPILPIMVLVNMLAKTYDIVFCTGRRESEREKTRTWIVKPSSHILTISFRPSGCGPLPSG